jgi:hypothetical protein
MSKFEKVKYYYMLVLWPLNWVENAVGKWITSDEFQEITGKEYK